MAEAPSIPIRILLVEDHTSLRQALALALGFDPELHIQAEAESLAEARQYLETEAAQVDVLILDLDLPDGDGSTLIPLLHDANPGAIALVLTGSTNPLAQARAIHAGADGFAHKSRPLTEIVDKLKRSAKGEPLISTRDIFNAASLASRHRPVPRLTRREQDVLAALAEGFNDREIADHLYVTRETVRTHVENIMGKLGATSRMQALVLAVRHGLVSID